jgi:hypothetical protein
MSLRKTLFPAMLIVTAAACLYAADITGKWTAEFPSEVGDQKYTFEFKADGATLTGTAISVIGGAQEKTPITEGKINGNEITFVENLNYQGMQLRIVYKGTVSGDEIKLTRVEGAGGESFVAKRVK